jgi:hypothetical protein
MKRLIITEEEKNRIKSLYFRNLISEGAICGEEDKKKFESTKKIIEGLLPIVSKFWIDWLEDPITKQKIKSANNFDDKKLEEVYKKYFDTISKIKFEYVGFCTDKNGGGYYAWVTQGDPEPIIYINVLNNQGKSVEFIEEVLVHEIQHLLYFIQPMTPELKIDSCFTVANKKQPTGLKKFILNLFGLSKKPSKIVDRISSSFGIDKNSAEKVKYFFETELNFQIKTDKVGYIVNTNENYSRVIELRKKFGIKPGQDLTISNFKPFIDKLLLSDDSDKYFEKLNSESPGVYYFLLHWAYKKYPDLQTILNQVNTLAMQQYEKEKYV